MPRSLRSRLLLGTFLAIAATAAVAGAARAADPSPYYRLQFQGEGETSGGRGGNVVTTDPVVYPPVLTPTPPTTPTRRDTLTAAFSPRVMTANSPPGQAVPRFSVDGGTGPYSWRNAGATPPGLALAPYGTGGSFAGTPSLAGSYPVDLVVTDSTGATGEAKGVLPVVDPGATTKVSAYVTAYGSMAGDPNGSLPFVSANEGDGRSHTFTVASLADPVPGVTPPPAIQGYGYFSGVPTYAGTYPLAISATDEAGNVGYATTTWVVAPAGDAPDGYIDAYPLTAGVQSGFMPSFSVNKTDANRYHPFSWSFSGLPDGMGPASASRSYGSFSGVPSTAGDYPVIGKVTDTSTGASSTVATIFHVAPAGSLSLSIIESARLRVGVPVETPYGSNEQVLLNTTNGGSVYPFDLSVTAGQLPPGLSFGPGSYYGTNIVGTPTQAGSFTFTLQAVDQDTGSVRPDDTTTSREFTMVVHDVGGDFQVVSTDVAAYAGSTGVPALTVTGAQAPYAFQVNCATACDQSHYAFSRQDGSLSLPDLGDAAAPVSMTVTVTDAAGHVGTSGPFTVSEFRYPGIERVAGLDDIVPGQAAGFAYSPPTAAGGPSFPGQWSSGALLPGFALDPVTGLLSGKASAEGDLPDVALVFTDRYGASATENPAEVAMGGFEMATRSTMAATVSDTRAHVGTTVLGVAVTHGRPPYGFADKASGGVAALPAGVTLNGDGTLSVALSAVPGAYPVAALSVTDARGRTAATGAFNVTVLAPLGPILPVPGLASVVVGAATAVPAVAPPPNAVGPGTWAAAAPLPGFTVDAASGVLSGTSPSAASTADLDLTYVDALGGKATEGDPALFPMVSTDTSFRLSTLPDTTVATGTVVSLAAPSATNAAGILTYAPVSTDAPPTGLSFANGTLRGIPTVAGTYVYSLSARDGAGHAATTNQATLTVVQGDTVPTPQLPASPCVVATAGQPTAATIQLWDGDPNAPTLESVQPVQAFNFFGHAFYPYTWSTTSDGATATQSLPVGLSLDPVTGEVYGTPAGAFSGTFALGQAQDGSFTGGGESGTVDFSHPFDGTKGFACLQVAPNPSAPAEPLVLGTSPDVVASQIHTYVDVPPPPVTGGSGSVSWSAEPPLPGQMSVTAAGHVTGELSVPGSVSYSLTATDTVTGQAVRTATKTLTLTEHDGSDPSDFRLVDQPCALDPTTNPFYYSDYYYETDIFGRNTTQVNPPTIAHGPTVQGTPGGAVSWAVSGGYPPGTSNADPVTGDLTGTVVGTGPIADHVYSWSVTAAVSSSGQYGDGTPYSYGYSTTGQSCIFVRLCHRDPFTCSADEQDGILD